MIDSKETKRQRFDRLMDEYLKLLDYNPIPRENIKQASKILDELAELAWNGLDDGAQK